MTTGYLYQERKRLRDLLSSGVRSDAHDGSATTFNSPEEIRRRILEIEREIGVKKQRSRFNTPNMGRR